MVMAKKNRSKTAKTTSNMKNRIITAINIIKKKAVQRWRQLIATVFVISFASVGAYLLLNGRAATPTTCDALCNRVRTELKTFTDWLATNNAKGYIGEMGIPQWSNGKWLPLADIWYDDANAAKLWVTPWTAGEHYDQNAQITTYKSSGGEGTPVDSPSPQTKVIEAHPTTSAYMRGMNLNSGPSTAGSVADTHASGYSNKTPGPFKRNSPKSVQYMASRGHKLLRLAVNWERLQPTLGAPIDLNSEYPAYVRSIIKLANDAGMTVNFDLHNFASYYEYDATLKTGKRRIVGTPSLPNSLFADSWTKIVKAYGDMNVVWGLMNEPARIPAQGSVQPAQVWEGSAQAALNAIRATGDKKVVLVAGYDYSAAAWWPNNHPKSWITDPANNFRYEAHQYWDRTYIGEYKYDYDDEVAFAKTKGYKDTAYVDPVTTDMTAPKVTLTSPVNGSTVTGKVDIRGTVVDYNPSHYNLVIEKNGKVVAGPGSVEQYQSISTAQTLFTWDASKSGAGSYTIRLEARDAFNNKDATSTATVNVTVAVTDTVSPVVKIDSPLSGSSVKGIVPIKATITDANPKQYYLVIVKNGAVAAGPGTVVQTQTITNQTLYNWDTTKFSTGTYTIRLEARDALGNKDATTSVKTINVNVVR